MEEEVDTEGAVGTQQGGSHQLGALASWKLALPPRLSSNAINSQFQYQPLPEQATAQASPKRKWIWGRISHTQRERENGWNEMSLRQCLGLSPVHITSHHWHSEPSPQNFPAGLSSSNVTPAHHLPPLLLCHPKATTWYGLWASICTHIFF